MDETGLGLDCTGDALLEHKRLADTTPDSQLESSTREIEEKGMVRQGQRERECEMAQMDAGMDISLLHNDREASRVAIIAGVSFLSSPLPSLCLLLAFPTPKAIHANRHFHNSRELPPQNRWLHHHPRAPLRYLATSNIRVMLLGPKSGMCEYVGARRAAEGPSFPADDIFYCHLFIKLHLPAFLHALRSFART
ncbi:hypothetical protein B0H13DRAFT_2521624 [Mycena leptocephala]|nr:hypothetical protein B0H13DRAFT_2521624 [Mycena leptocephala]